MTFLEQACADILYKNMSYTDEKVYHLYDIESPLAKILSNAWNAVLPENSISREFINPPQPLYRGGLINPDNPHKLDQNRIVTSHNIAENTKIWLDHHIKMELQWADEVDPQIEFIKNELLTLPKGSIVILVQSTNFRLSTFRIRLELFNLGIHVIEFNHLAYIPESQYDTFIESLQYRTDEYMELTRKFSECMNTAQKIRVQSLNDDFLDFWPVEKIRGNTGDYTSVENKGGTFPIGEIFTEAKDLSSVSWAVLIESYPNEDFSVNICDTPFLLTIEKWRVLPSPDFPPSFAKLYNWIMEFENEVMVRELGLWLNPAISNTSPLADINFHERKLWVHLSLGKKHGIYGKKLPKTELQRFHIDVFVALKWVYVDDVSVFDEEKWWIL